MKVLLAYSNEYECEIFKEMRKAFGVEGVECEVIRFDDIKFQNNIEHEKLTCLAINKFRPSTISERLRWITWVQDRTIETTSITKARVGSNSLLYLLCSEEMLGISIEKNVQFNYLQTGITEKIIKKRERDIDILIVGFIPPEYCSIKNSFRMVRIPLLETIIKILPKRLRLAYISRVVHNLYEPFKGCLADGYFMGKIKKFLKNANFEELHDDDYLMNLEISYARYIDRYLFAKLAKNLSGINFEIYGIGWDGYGFGSNYKGVARYCDLKSIYARSKIVIHTNPYGFGMHSRVLEAMSMGCCVVTHESRKGNYEGQLNLNFEQDIEYVEVSLRSAKRRIKELLNKRTWESVGRHAENKVNNNFRWDKCVKRIVADLMQQDLICTERSVV